MKYHEFDNLNKYRIAKEKGLCGAAKQLRRTLYGYYPIPKQIHFDLFKAKLELSVDAS